MFEASTYKNEGGRRSRWPATVCMAVSQQQKEEEQKDNNETKKDHGGLKRSRLVTVNMLQPNRTLVSRGNRLVIVDMWQNHEKQEATEKEGDQQQFKRSSRSRQHSRLVIGDTGDMLQLQEDQQQAEQLGEQHQAEQASEQEDLLKQQKEKPQCVPYKRSSRSRLSSRHVTGGMFQLMEDIRPQAEQQGEQQLGEQLQAEQASEQQDLPKQQQEEPQCVTYKRSSRSRLSGSHVTGGMFQLMEHIRPQAEQQGEQQQSKQLQAEQLQSEQLQAEQASEKEDLLKQQQEKPLCVTYKRSSRSRHSSWHVTGGMFQLLEAIPEEDEEEEKEGGEEEEGEEDDYGEDEEGEEEEEETGEKEAEKQLEEEQQDQQEAEQHVEQHHAEQAQAEQADQYAEQQQQEEEEEEEDDNVEHEEEELEEEEEEELEEEEEEEEQEKHSDSELQPGDHAVETEELEEEERKLHYYYDLEPISRSFIDIDRGTHYDAMYLYAESKGYFSWQCYQYAEVHGKGIRTFEDSQWHIFPSKYLMALRRELFVKERRHEQLKWVYKRLKEQGHSLATKAKKRVGRSAISLMVAHTFVRVQRKIEYNY